MRKTLLYGKSQQKVFHLNDINVQNKVVVISNRFGVSLTRNFTRRTVHLLLTSLDVRERDVHKFYRMWKCLWLKVVVSPFPFE